MDIPKNSTSNTTYAIAKGVLSSIPAIGGLASELLPLLLQSPLEKRRDEWMAYMGDKLKELEAAGLNLQELANSEEFISATLHATHIALRTHLKLKHEALRNAVANIALQKSPQDAIQTFFLNCIDDFTDIHVTILRIYDEKTPYEEIKNGDALYMRKRIPEMANSPHIFDAFCAELISRGLVYGDGWYMQPGPPTSYGWRTTSVGKQLLSFISDSSVLPV